MIRKTPDDSDRNLDIVHMIKKIAIGLESKNVDDLRTIAHELEAWVPHGNWGKLDVKTKVFVEHILIALARLQLGFEILDKGADELTDIRQKVEKDEIHGLMDEADHEDDFERKMRELASEYNEIVDEAQEITTENIDRFTRRNLDRVDRREKFTCEKCGIEKRSSAPGVNNRIEVDGHVICARCYRAFRNWFEKTDKKAAEGFLDSVSECDCSICKSSKCGKCGRVIDHVNSKIFSDYGICIKCYSEEPNIDEIYKDESIVPKSKYAGAPYDQDKDEKDIRRACFSETFTCEKCGIEKRSSAPGVNNRKEVDGHVICGRCYRAFKNWFEKTNRKLDEFWDEKYVRKGTWDGGPIDPSVKEGIRRLMRDYSLPNGQIDWKRFHRARKKMKDHKERRNKERYRKPEFSDDEKEDLK